MQRLGFLMATLVILAGCAEPATPEPKATTATSAPPAIVDAEFGSIAGNVTDDELVPLAGVEVALIETMTTVRSDAQGHFTFNELAPGSYRLVATRVGFQQTGKRVDVVAEQITSVSLALEPFAFENVSYHYAIPAKFHVQAGWGLFDALVAWPYANQTCGDCQKMIDFPRGPTDVAVEPVWTPSTNTQATNQDLYVWMEKDVEPGTNVHSDYKKNRESHRFTDAELAKVKEFKNFRINVGGGVTSVMIQQSAEVWTTVSYGAKLPGDYTALPT